MDNTNLLNKKYTPINGDFYDKLEAAATQNIRCELIYSDSEGIEHNVISRIEDLYTHDHIEYAVLEDTTIRLDQIKVLNGEQIAPPKQYKKEVKDVFSQKFYSDEIRIVVDENDFYSLIVNKAKNIIELKPLAQWNTLENIPELKSQLIMVAEHMDENFGLVNDLTALVPDASGTLFAPFIPARGILINGGLVKVADLLPLNCETLVHDRGSFSVNSLKVRQFKDKYFAENWASER